MFILSKELLMTLTKEFKVEKLFDNALVKLNKNTLTTLASSSNAFITPVFFVFTGYLGNSSAANTATQTFNLDYSDNGSDWITWCTATRRRTPGNRGDFYGIPICAIPTNPSISGVIKFESLLHSANYWRITGKSTDTDSSVSGTCAVYGIKN